jgi:Na+-translocating ferredoxin:NAD+ oxidoreductase RnfG subunit
MLVKMAFKIPLRHVLVPVVLALLPASFLGGVGVARAETAYYTPRSVLADFFPKSQRVSYHKFDLSPEAHARVAKKLGAPLSRPSYTFYIAQTGDLVDGYALIDEEPGEHLPITFAVKFSPAGAVLRQEIMVYRERYGDEVRDERFRKQFIGKTAADRLRPGDDIVAVSGATISSRAMVVGVRRALLLLDELVLGPQRSRSAAGSPGSSGGALASRAGSL